jgi:hypothetical protein
MAAPGIGSSAIASPEGHLRISPDKMDQSVRDASVRMREATPNVPLVVLGQTVFWDEPVKGALFAALQALGAGARPLLMGINDHDYFSKTAAPLPPSQPFALLAHNDNSTRDLWVAAGELSMLVFASSGRKGELGRAVVWRKGVGGGGAGVAGADRCS